MIYDLLKNAHRYMGQSKWLDAAIHFLETTDLNELPIGRTEIWKDKVFANVMEAQAKDETEVKFEIHKKYMDIQIDLKGTEKIIIGLKPDKVIDSYREDTDFGTVECSPAAECIMGEGRFIVCMGEEPHKPGIAVQEERYLKKCVLKVAENRIKGGQRAE